MSIDSFNSFVDKYKDFLGDTWRRADQNERKRITEIHTKLLNSGEFEWNEFVDEVIESSGGQDYLLNLITFNFNNTEITNTKFYGYNFRFDMTFTSIEFKKDVVFSISHFGGISIFKDVTFHQKLQINSKDANELVIFNSCTFVKEVTIGQFKFNKDIVFNFCSFQSDFRFLSNRVEGLLIIDNCSFEEILPDLRGSKFSLPVSVSNFKYEEDQILMWIENEDYHTENSARFRVLKDFAQQNNDHLTSLKYFSYEMKSEEKSKDQFQFFSKIYGVFSNYGRSIIRPVITLSLIVVLFLAINLISINKSESNCNSIFNSILIITVNNSIPFDLAFDESTIKCAYKVYGTGERRPLMFQLIDLLQVILSYLAWFLLLLSLRNRFKI